MVPFATALALCLALLLACPTRSEELASPQHVRFAAEVARHLLRWEPGHDSPSSARYDVEYKVYGSKVNWTAIPECGKTSEHFCDLTYYTLDSERRYYAQVRAVSGNRTSPWQRTNAFSPQEAGLRLASKSLSVRGNSIQVRLQLLLRSGNITVEYSDFQKEMTQYHVHVRRTQDNHTFRVLEKSAEFTISDLFSVTEYCVSVEPSMANRPVPATRTDEQCITTGHRDGSTELLSGILSSSFIILLLLGLLGALLARTYIRKPVRTPSALKSFMKQSSLWVEHEPPSSGSLDADPIQQLFLGQKEPQPDSSPDGSTSTAELSLEQGWKLPAWPKDQLGPTGSRDSSGTSTDSGICLHIPSSSSSLSCSAGPEPQGYRQQLPTAEDSGVGLESPCPAPGCSSGSGNASPGEPGLSPTIQEDVEFRGYLQQSKGTVQPEQALDKGMPLLGCAGSVQGLGSTDTVLDIECSELAVSKGYLKQSSPEHPLTQDLAPWGAPAWDFSSQMGPQAPTLLSWVAPGAPLTSKASPELLKSPFDLSIFDNTAFLGTLPLVSSLSSDWITLPIKPLTRLGGDSKDSRL
ncbi:interleukin-10 receptor subunit alpha [Corvus cornix cornix]|uniref:interleukin-10 receptor subunit alpha n=1 Tax=Corvus cornix cornix TaxID=932674 RepID=UPI00194EA941|nr:interleukin-10 receptor subunit alpha [Corvus cornix cornix]